MSEPVPEPIAYEEIVNRRFDNANNNTNQVVEPEPLVVPDEFNLDVPFTTQAPDANWELPYQEACEEASAITVHYYYQGKTFTKEIADQEIKDLVAWEEENLGFYKDTTAEETAQFIKGYWDYKKVEVIKDPTVEIIKENIASGRPVIIPAAGQQLGNPYFTPPGPLYHMLVIRGYTETQFVTNDVGTRHGENYMYDVEIIMSSIHDWNNGDVDNGQKAIIVVYPND